MILMIIVLFFSPSFLTLAFCVPTMFLGSSVAEVKATDADVGKNAEVSYRFQVGSFGDFELAQESGIVTLKRKLDYDKRPQYDVIVLAVDHGEDRIDN